VREREYPGGGCGGVKLVLVTRAMRFRVVERMRSGSEWRQEMTCIDSGGGERTGDGGAQ
jgi:hypothetical protein